MVLQVVPHALKFADGTPVRTDWNRVMTTCFNGASNVAQAGGLACTSEAGMAAMWELVGYYKASATSLTLEACYVNVEFLPDERRARMTVHSHNAQIDILSTSKMRSAT